MVGRAPGRAWVGRMVHSLSHCRCLRMTETVNDPFVMKVWAKPFPENKHVKFLADGSASYTRALGLEMDLGDKGLGTRLVFYILYVLRDVGLEMDVYALFVFLNGEE
ncbi:hypothetical protein QQ045_001418 [Rhodiola kirilowii]